MHGFQRGNYLFSFQKSQNAVQYVYISDTMPLILRRKWVEERHIFLLGWKESKPVSGIYYPLCVHVYVCTSELQQCYSYLIHLLAVSPLPSVERSSQSFICAYFSSPPLGLLAAYFREKIFTIVRSCLKG